MVRDAVAGDLDALLPLMRECHAASVDSDLPFCDDTARTVSVGLIESDSAAILTNETAFIALVLVPFHFNRTRTMALELGFYGKNGGELIEAAKEWARERGAHRFVAGNENTPRSKAMDRWYRRHGMTPRGASYEAKLWE